MRYIFLMVFMAAIVFVSCSKTNSTNANVLFYNGSWSVAPISAAWNGNNIVTTPIAQGLSSGTADKPYLQVPAGTNLVTLRAGTDTLVNKNIYTAAATGNSFLFFDTSTTGTSKLSILQLVDDLSIPDTAQIKYRFIDLSPDTAATADVWLVHGVTDSLRLDTAAVFIGKDAAASSIQTFTAIKYHGEAYTVKIKKTGQETIFASLPSYVFTVKGTYSIIFSGLSTGTGSTGFKLSVLHHFTQ